MNKMTLNKKEVIMHSITILKQIFIENLVVIIENRYKRKMDQCKDSLSSCSSIGRALVL